MVRNETGQITCYKSGPITCTLHVFRMSVTNFGDCDLLGRNWLHKCGNGCRRRSPVADVAVLEEADVMLDIAVAFLADEFNAYLLRRTGSPTPFRMVPAAVLDDKGALAIASGTVALSIVNIEEERVMRQQLPSRVVSGGRELLLQPELKLNLTLLFAARMVDYPTTLKALSHVLTFFQSHPAFSADDYPHLDPRVGKIVMGSTASGRKP